MVCIQRFFWVLKGWNGAEPKKGFVDDDLRLKLLYLVVLGLELIDSLVPFLTDPLVPLDNLLRLVLGLELPGNLIPLLIEARQNAASAPPVVQN